MHTPKIYVWNNRGAGGHDDDAKMNSHPESILINELILDQSVFLGE